MAGQLLFDKVGDFRFQTFRGRMAGFEGDKGFDDLAAKSVGLTDNASLGHGGMGDEGGLNFEGTNALALGFDDVGGPADKPKK